MLGNITKKLLLPIKDPRLLVGFETSDDAGVFALTSDIALVQTLDFFTPIVDDPYWFGRISAANALSDVYAMGGKPLTALNIVCYPENDLELDILERVLEGGSDALKLSQTTLLGGHSVSDSELKYGLSVTGTVDPNKIITNTGVKPGDLLVLTKPLGTGILCTALKRGLLPDDLLNIVTQTMASLNDKASFLMQELLVKGATDITGFGFLGHALELARGSNVNITFEANKIPVFKNVIKYIDDGIQTKGERLNHDYLSLHISFSENISNSLRHILYDPQTSGGLLIAIPEKKLKDFELLCEKYSLETAVVVGQANSFHSNRDSDHIFINII